MITPQLVRVLPAFCAFGAICSVGLALGDPAYTPCILNGHGVPITFLATFSDGTSSPGSLPSGSAAWQRIKGRHLRSLSVIAPDAAKRVYTESTLNRERNKHAVKDELWVVSEHGIRLEDRRRIEAVRKVLVQPRT